MRGDDVSATSWVCAQVWSKAECYKAGTWAVDSFRGGAAVATKNVELAFLVHSLYLRVSERVGVWGEVVRNGIMQG